MKTVWMLTLLAGTLALKAAEPAAPPSVPVSTNAPALSEDLAEQAALVQQIGEEAARGFDPEAHAHALRLQIEALASRTPDAKTLVPTRTPVAPAPAVTAPPSSRPAAEAVPSVTVVSPVRPGRDGALREVIQKLRSALADLETQVNAGPKDR